MSGQIGMVWLKSGRPVQTARNDSSSDAIPPHAPQEIAARLHRRRRGRMIGRDQIERAGMQAGPQRSAMRPLADRRRALELGRAVRNLFGGKRQVVRTRFRGDRDAVGFGARDGVYRFSRRHVDDVDARAELAREADDHGRSPTPRLAAAVSRGTSRMPAGRIPGAGVRRSAGFSAWTSSGTARRARSASPRANRPHRRAGIRPHPTARGNT